MYWSIQFSIKLWLASNLIYTDDLTSIGMFSGSTCVVKCWVSKKRIALPTVEKQETEMSWHGYLRLLWVAGLQRSWLSKTLKWCSLSLAHLTLVFLIILHETHNWLIWPCGFQQLLQVHKTLSTFQPLQLSPFWGKAFFLWKLHVLISYKDFSYTLEIPKWVCGSLTLPNVLCHM